MVDYSGPRAPTWEYQLLDSEDRPLGRLDGVLPGGKIEAVALSRLGGSGSLTIDERGQAIDWMSHRVQVSYDPGIAGVDGWPVATMMFTSPEAQYTEFGATYSVTLLTKLAVVDEDTVEAVTSFAEGTPIIPAVVALIESSGETRIAVTDTGAVLRGPQLFPAGESKLTIINKLLEAAGYWSLRVDRLGQFRVEPYVDTAARPVAHVFGAGDASIVAADWVREQDMSSVPNRFLVIGQGDDEEPPLVGVALNEDPSSPYSFQARGRWITRTEEGVEGADQAVFDQLARRRLEDAMSPVARISAEHGVVPAEPNEVIEFRPEGEAMRRATIMRLTYTLTDDADCVAEWRETQ